MPRKSEGRLVPLSCLARSPLLGRRGTNATMVSRWATKGRNGVWLRTERVDGAVCSSLLWFKEFIRESRLGESPANAGLPRASRCSPYPQGGPRHKEEP